MKGRTPIGLIPHPSPLRVELGEPAQSSQAGHEGVLAAPREDEPRQALKSPPDAAATWVAFFFT